MGRYAGSAALFVLAACLGAARLTAETPLPGPASASPAPLRRPNHLINEKSPYLLQHAYNPVDWYPWGEEAFAKARRENRPIFLSVGYSTCHWCHVMARESFENEAIARQMNESFVCIKVDREERPDIDAVYMDFVQSTTDGGGWPMTVFLTPDLKPFFGGSYFPPEDRDGNPGLRTLLPRMAGAWKSDPGQVGANAARIMTELRQAAQAGPGAKKIGGQAMDDAYREFAGGFDSKAGGFGGAPKFLRPVVLAFLFQVYAADPASERGRQALDMALYTLRRAAEGGIHDALGGGFHRYTVDADWRVPHFEKMLYDQAQIADSYLTAFQITRDPFFADTARDIFAYVGSDLIDPRGGFYCAQDADSQISADRPEHGEGAFYVWARGDVDRIVGTERAKAFDYRFGVEPDGNVSADPQGEFVGRNILSQRHSLEETARFAGLSEADAKRSLEESRGLLFAARGGRPRPHTDDKVLTSWNGLMISAYSRGFQVLGDPAYLESARRAAGFIEQTMYRSNDGLLQRSYYKGQVSIDGFGDDYAYLIQGLLDLYEASFDVHWLKWAWQLQGKQNELFLDAANGGYFGTTGRDADVLLRMKEGFDGAEPSVNSVSALNLLRFSYLFDDPPTRALGERTIQAFAGHIRRYPSNYPQMLAGFDWLRNAPREIVIEGREGAADTAAMLAEMNRHFIPNKVVILAEGGAGQEFLGQRLDFLRNLPSGQTGPATAYVCQNYQCRLPTTDLGKFAELLANP
jgi:hypothetical protein